MAKKGTSNVPMVLGIIGGVLGVPASYCSGLCATFVIAVDEASSGTSTAADDGMIFIWMGLIGAALGLIGGLLGKATPTVAGIIMIIAAFLSGFTLIAGNMLALIVAILFLIGGYFCFSQKKKQVSSE